MFSGDQCGAVSTHVFGDIRTNHLYAQKFFKGPEHSWIFKRSSLDHYFRAEY